MIKAIGTRGRPDISMTTLTRMMRSVRGTVGDVYDDIFSTLEGELKQFGGDDARFNASMLTTALPPEVAALVTIETVAPAQVAAAAAAKPFQGALLKEWPERLGEDLLRSLTNAVRNGYLQGTPTEQIIRDVNLGTAGRNLNAVVRTAVGHYAATARELVADANSDIVKAEVWLSTLDSHTSTLCIVRDQLPYRRNSEGKMVGIGHAVPWGAGPGRLHFCCRSTSVMVTKSLAEMKLNPSDFSSATRASMNGQVPSNTKFADWIINQPQSVLDDTFGIERAYLIRQGKVKVPDLFTDDGKYLTLDQLKAHVPE